MSEKVINTRARKLRKTKNKDVCVLEQVYWREILDNFINQTWIGNALKRPQPTPHRPSKIESTKKGGSWSTLHRGVAYTLPQNVTEGCPSERRAKVNVFPVVEEE
ncbi:hypothetical protein PoB_005146200 [Plakobranchus ocellatus]|uniref:Uncharacterized protein n=1 Tax=Plakobranchus ocellatus TaxID=259542 RepID=A0AAV4C050_9GAST|nr:hypothetical protein PoB_005146200 [Plakobranchus ocellatus]